MELDGKRYHVYVTWDDVTCGRTSYRQDARGTSDHKYFLLDNATLANLDQGSHRYDTAVYNFTDTTYLSGYAFCGRRAPFFYINGAIHTIFPDSGGKDGVRRYEDLKSDDVGEFKPYFAGVRVGDLIYWTRDFMANGPRIIHCTHVKTGQDRTIALAGATYQSGISLFCADGKGKCLGGRAELRDPGRRGAENGHRSGPGLSAGRRAADLHPGRRQLDASAPGRCGHPKCILNHPGRRFSAAPFRVLLHRMIWSLGRQYKFCRCVGK